MLNHCSTDIVTKRQYKVESIGSLGSHTTSLLSLILRGSNSKLFLSNITFQQRDADSLEAKTSIIFCMLAVLSKFLLPNIQYTRRTLVNNFPLMTLKAKILGQRTRAGYVHILRFSLIHFIQKQHKVVFDIKFLLFEWLINTLRFKQLKGLLLGWPKESVQRSPSTVFVLDFTRMHMLYTSDGIRY